MSDTGRVELEESAELRDVDSVALVSDVLDLDEVDSVLDETTLVEVTLVFVG